MEKTIICIGREYGSGGHAIGKILAKRTGYEFYDKERVRNKSHSWGIDNRLWDLFIYA